MEFYSQDFWLVRLFFQRGLAVIYLLAFTSALNQFCQLLGKDGFLPVQNFLKYVSFKATPSIFHFHYSDSFFKCVAWLGIIASFFAIFGLSEGGPLWFSISVWLLLWILYLSIVNVGQVFYGFGWESMLLEAGFFSIFLGNQKLILQ